jgi:EAL domain-containing protein (putative c-di-GMP-specific phosphodiesterase class I)
LVVFDEIGAELDAVIAAEAVHPVFQPIVSLHDRAVVAYEALARGPRGDLHAPDRLFGAARERGRLADLDALCQRRALEVAVEARLRRPMSLFVNVEPAGMTEQGPLPELLVAPRVHRVNVVVEVTERALLADPGRLLSFAGTLRGAGVGLALDDVGAEPASLALLPFLRPDVVKLDLAVLHRHSGPDLARIMTAVTAFAEESGAIVLAEGIETEVHEHVAGSLGATHGQGRRFGCPGPIEDVPPPDPGRQVFPPPRLPRTRPRPDSPFAIGARHRDPLPGTAGLLREVSRLLEEHAAVTDGPSVVLAAFQERRHVTDAVAHRYAELAERTTLVVALGADIGPEPVPGVRGADLAADDPLRDEWSVVVLGPHFAGALVARDLHTRGPDGDRLFDYVLTYDRSVVTVMAQALMARAVARPEG